MRPLPFSRAVAAVAVVLTAGLLASCTPRSSEMTAKPSVDAVVAKYDAAAAKIRDAVSAEYPDATWTEGRPAATSFGDSDDQTRVSSPIWTAPASLAADTATRDRVVAAADGALREAGFDDFATVVAEPGQFEYVAADAWGGQFSFGGGSVNVTLSYTTGSLPKD